MTAVVLDRNEGRPVDATALVLSFSPAKLSYVAGRAELRLWGFTARTQSPDRRGVHSGSSVAR